MKSPAFPEVREAIEYRLEQINELLGELEYEYEEYTAQEFYDYLSGEIFCGDKVTLLDIIGNEYLMIHHVIETSELKKMGLKLDAETGKRSPTESMYKAHLFAVDYELNYALLLEDYYWLKHRLSYHEEFLKNDSNMPRTLKPQAEEILRNYGRYREA